MRVMMAEQRACFVDPAFGDQPAHARAADDEVLVADRDRFSPRETRSARRGCAAAKSCPRDRVRTESSRRPRPRPRAATRRARMRTNVSGSQRASSGVNRTMATPCMPPRASASSFCWCVISSGRRLVGPDDLRRMRIERHRHGRRPTLFGAPPHALDDFQVTAVHAVEIAEREDRLMPPRRPWIIRIVNDLHQRSISKVRPSYAN